MLMIICAKYNKNPFEAADVSERTQDVHLSFAVFDETHNQIPRSHGSKSTVIVWANEHYINMLIAKA